MPQTLTQKHVQELFRYKAGRLLWRKSPRYGIEAGDVAGGPHNRGYWRIKVRGKYYLAHRLIYLYHHGYFPENKVDHRNRNKLRNSIGNLREATTSCNARNAKQQSNNTSGVKGISKAKTAKKWSAHICVHGKHINIGSASCFLEAVCLRLAAEQAENWAGCEATSPAFLYVQQHITKRTHYAADA